ncbi:MAG TPA: hypothetical protein VHD62_09475 [Opitutaceae bacterium]|nr:hypothetical protein [Opitutaceae bacterium]
MGYIIGLVIVLVLVPLLFALLNRRPTRQAGSGSGDRGMTVANPSSDQPSPGGHAGDPTRAEAARRLPPG